MAILVDRNTKALIQGIAGKEGSRACREMLAYGTAVVAGVVPEMGGKHVEGVPVYDSVREALEQHPGISATLIVVPAKFLKDAALEAIEAGIRLVNIITEHVPAQDCAYIVQAARAKGVRVVGPSSVGIISPGKAKIGSIGSSEIQKVFQSGSIGVISKSGGMTAEIASTLTMAGIGQSTVLGIGGDQIIGSDFVDILRLFEEDRETRAVVLFGEIGGTYEEQAAACIAKGGFTKPVVAVVAGEFTRNLPQGTALGHAGAIVEKGRGSYDAKVSALKKAGVHIANILDDIPALLRKALAEA